MRLLLIRHGQTPNNVVGALDTAFPGAGLTELGHTQARAVPAALADEPIAGLYASRLVRTQLTAAPLAEARGLEVVVRDGLEEISAGDLEMRSDLDSVKAYAGSVGAWLEGDLDHRVPGGPSGREFRERYDAAVREIAAAHGPDDTVAVVSHGAAIRAWSTLAAGIDPDTATELFLRNTGLSVVAGSPDGGWRLERWSSDPLGGPGLAGEHAHDVTGESADEVAEEE
ncbi:histidine phosphatase family protein [Nocardioides alkalitolerans]|uniref:histidine phosphatase family protein n=1 Tax=Nocardioides alkalitolerans TaxID=281714 RepID=UPI000418D211|nr:histidine phosphatase family protein [Nocardioides alkalitolerans]